MMSNSSYFEDLEFICQTERPKNGNNVFEAGDMSTYSDNSDFAYYHAQNPKVGIKSNI